MKMDKHLFWNLAFMNDYSINVITTEYNEFFDPSRDSCKLYSTEEIERLGKIFKEFKKPVIAPNENTFVAQQILIEFYNQIIDKFNEK